MATDGKSGQALGLIRKHCDSCATAEWQKEIAYRRRHSLQPAPDDGEIMRRICVAIAYSQGSRSSLIGGLIQTSIFKEAFAGFDPVLLARCDPEHILSKYWRGLGYLRFRGKVPRIVRCARVLNGIIREQGSFAAYLQRFNIPRRIQTVRQLDQFWQQFDELQQDLKRREMPFFRSTTSLLQLLLDLDYDSVKPDLIVMRLARRIAIVKRETGELAIRQCVRFLQAYSIKNACRASELDLALLAFGGQSGAGQLLTRRFCPAYDPCRHATCCIGNNRMCSAKEFTVR